MTAIPTTLPLLTPTPRRMSTTASALAAAGGFVLSGGLAATADVSQWTPQAVAAIISALAAATVSVIVAWRNNGNSRVENAANKAADNAAEAKQAAEQSVPLSQLQALLDQAARRGAEEALRRVETPKIQT